ATRRPAMPQAPVLPAAGPGGSVLSSFMGRIRDVGSRVTETVAAMSREGLDLHYLTSRLAVMSYPARASSPPIAITTRTAAYAVYNLSTRRYPQSRFEGRVSEVGWEAGTAPPLASLFAILRNMQLWLRQGPHTICVLHCPGRKASGSAPWCPPPPAASSAFSLHRRHGLPRAVRARRCPPNISPSQLVYADYTAEMAADPPRLPHRRPVMLVTLTLTTPVPMFNPPRLHPLRRGLGQRRAGAEHLSESYEAMRPALVEDGQVRLGLNISVCGDVTISVFHARSTLGGKMQGRISSMKICQVQFHTGFVREDFDRLNFTKCELDFLDTDDKYSSDFKLSLDLVRVAAGQAASGRAAALGRLPGARFEAPPVSVRRRGARQAARRFHARRRGAPLASPVSSQDSPLADNEPAAPPPPPPPPPHHRSRSAKAALPSSTPWTGSTWRSRRHRRNRQSASRSSSATRGPRDYEAEALRAAHREAERGSRRGRSREAAQTVWRRRVAAVLAISVRRKSRTGRPIWSNPRALNDVSAGVADLLGFGGGGGGGGRQQRRPEPSGLVGLAAPDPIQRRPAQRPVLLGPAPAAASAGTTATPPPKAPYVVDDFFGGPNFTGAGHGNFVGAAQKSAQRAPRSLHTRCGTRPGRSLWTRSGPKLKPGVAGKERNVRGSALLAAHGSVSMATWCPGDQVKKVYRKACLAVHPDKWAGTQHEAFSKLVFVELQRRLVRLRGVRHEEPLLSGRCTRPSPDPQIHHRILISLTAAQNFFNCSKQRRSASYQ
uniref:C2 tensin-type domain-containing protein n=1 Tax=Macrostomum lignano TaxID=282301 RepID=A0A1I8F6W5_9PLAT